VIGLGLPNQRKRENKKRKKVVTVFPKERKKERRKERRKERKKDGSSGLPSYCTPLVCVPYVLGALAVWRQNIKRKIFLL